MTSSTDGQCYVVKRLLGCRLSEDKARTVLNGWIQFGEKFGIGSLPHSSHAVLASQSHQRLRGTHPTILTPRAIFPSKDFSDPAGLCIVYDYVPNGGALQPSFDPSVTIPIDAIWNYTIQLVNAVVALHKNGLAAREMLKPGRVLLTPADQR